MPELAEVEYVARQMRAAIAGATIARARIVWPGAIACPDAATFAREIAGTPITSVGRRGKLLVLTLGDACALVIHRRMTGNLTLVDPGAPDEPYLRVALDLRDGRRLLFTDPRKFGRLALLDRDALSVTLATLGPEPLDPAFTPDDLASILAGSQRAIKALLLDQRAIAGIGNIYADEALFYAQIHPLRPARSLSADEAARLHAGIVQALTTGIANGGTTFGRHRDLFGQAGTNVDHIVAYRRAGQPCVRCGTPIARIVVAQRGSHFCPHCQPPAPAGAVPTP
jgi:formamidopyrimidine-DNA glycosylase